MINTSSWLSKEKSSFFHFFQDWFCSFLFTPWSQSLAGCWLSLPDLPCTPQASPTSHQKVILRKSNPVLSEAPVSWKCSSWTRKTVKYFPCCLVTSFSNGCNSRCNYSANKSKSHYPLHIKPTQTTPKSSILSVSNSRYLCIGLWQHGQELKFI